MRSRSNSRSRFIVYKANLKDKFTVEVSFIIKVNVKEKSSAKLKNQGYAQKQGILWLKALVRVGSKIISTLFLRYILVLYI